MPKLPFKRRTADEANPINAYLPLQMVDYTSLPPIEEDTAMSKFKQMSAITRLMLVLLPVLLVAGIGYGAWQFLAPAEPVAAEPVPQPAFDSLEARAVSADAIAVKATFQHVPDGTTATVRLLDGDQSISFTDDAALTAVVQSNTLQMRLPKRAANAATLSASEVYAVELTVGDASAPLIAQTDLVVPDMLAATFFKAPEPTAAPTVEASVAPEPTVAPTAAPTEVPVPSGPPTVEVSLASTMLVSPTLGMDTITTLSAGQSFAPLFRTDDSAFFLVKHNDRVGWVPAVDLRFDAAQAATIRSIVPDAAAVKAGPLMTTVFNGGNIRWLPSTETGTILGQLHAGQRVTLREQTADGNWIHVVAPEAEGWVSVSLLDYDEQLFAAIPLAN